MYLPKHKYRVIFTGGGEYELVSNREEYTGYLFETAVGTFFTGKKPTASSKQLQEIERITGFVSGKDDGTGIGINDASPLILREDYDDIRQNSQEYALKNTERIPLYYPKPMPIDYGKKFIVRYFAIEKTTDRVLEISKEVYTSLNSKEPKYYYPKYSTKAIQWSLVNVRANQDTIRVSELDSYLKDPSQFVR